MKRIDLTGTKHNRLSVIKYSHTKNNKRYWECLCDCGKTTVVLTSKLTTCATKSCGCSRLTHGATSRIKGRSYLYRVWEGIKQRCNNCHDTSYDNYGGRGITVCAEWNSSYESFRDWAIKNGWKRGVDIDREDNDKGYSPDNCRFISRSENNLNTRIRKTNTSGFTGVTKHSQNKSWDMEIAFKGKRIRKSGFRTAEEAAKARDEAILMNNIPAKLHGGM